MAKQTAKIPDAVKKVLAGEGHDPHVAEIVGYFIEWAGGTRKFAKLLMDEYRNPDATPATRQRILDCILRSMKWANEQQGGTDDLGMMSNEDLEREAARILREHGGQGQNPGNAGPG